MTHPFDLAGRAALVTGSARGLGFEIARALGAAGADVILNGRDAERLSAAVATLAGQGIAAHALPADVAAEPEGIAERAAALAGRLDIVVANVGQRDRRATPELPTEDFRRLLDVDLIAAYGLARGALPLLVESGAGRLIFVTSIAGPLARAGDAAYTAAKGGLAALARSLAVEFGAQGITVNAIAPGWFATEANSAFIGNPEIDAFIARRVPAKRWGAPPEIGGAAVFLASDAAAYVNGHTLTVDGGLSVSF